MTAVAALRRAAEPHRQPRPAPKPPAPAPYDVLAPVYQLLTGDYGYGTWVGSLLDLAHRHGLSGTRALDVACGDGNAVLPLLEHGFDVTGCDISRAMVAQAARRSGGRARCLVADMRDLPVLGRFDLVTCLGDVFNHLEEPADVAAALRGIRRNLNPGGVAVFDLNLLAAYRAVPDVTLEDEDRIVTWRGEAARIDAPGGRGAVVVDVYTRAGADWVRETCHQPHRHHPLAGMRAAVEAAGLRVAAVHGQHPGGVLDGHADESLHPKAVIVATRPPCPPPASVPPSRPRREGR